MESAQTPTDVQVGGTSNWKMEPVHFTDEYLRQFYYVLSDMTEVERQAYKEECKALSWISL
jgi:hypothetical protein